MKPNKYLLNLINNIFPMVVNKNNLIIYGKPSRRKSFVIKMLSYLYSKTISKKFSLFIYFYLFKKNLYT
jgi:hypothetical protein